MAKKLGAASRIRASVVEADDHPAADADTRHWLLRVKSVLRLAKGQGAMKIAEANEEENTVVIQMRPEVYLDPTIMLKLIMIFKKEGLAMVISAKSNLVSILVGPEGFLEEKTGAAV